MEIRKEFRYEMGHIVRKAWSRRCSKNAHGHSYRVEYLFEGGDSDNGQMLVDFGFLKKALHSFVDAFDHSFWLWDLPEDKHIVEFFTKNFERVVVSPYSTTAEMQAKLFYTYADAVVRYLTEKNKFENGEKNVQVSAVRVHETTTGYAEYRRGQKDSFPETKITALKFSEQIQKEWSTEFQQFYHELIAWLQPKPQTQTELHISGRQVGKTTQLVKAAVDWSNEGNIAVIYTSSYATAEHIIEMISQHPCLSRDGRIYVVPFDDRDQLKGWKLTNPRYFYDEFDFFNYPADHEFEQNVYLATTPKFLRYTWTPRDPIYRALKRTGGTFWAQVTPNQNITPLSEKGVLTVINGKCHPSVTSPSLSREEAFYKIDVD